MPIRAEEQLVKNSVKLLEAWIKKNGCQLISQKRVLPTAIIAASIFNDGDDDQILAFGASTLWLFGVDRWFDETEYKHQNVFKKFCFFDGVLQPADKKPRSDDVLEISKAYHDLFLFLANFKSFQYLQHHWIKSLTDVLFLGMSFERLNKKSNSYEEYIYFGRESIGVKFVNLSTFISMNINLEYKDYVYFDSLQNLSAEIIRLTNDLVTNSKELLEGKHNVLSVLGTTVKNPTEWVKNVIIQKEKQLIELVSQSPSGLHVFSKYVMGLVKTTLRFYQDSDFYDDARSLEQKHIRKSG